MGWDAEGGDEKKWEGAGEEYVVAGREDFGWRLKLTDHSASEWGGCTEKPWKRGKIRPGSTGRCVVFSFWMVLSWKLGHGLLPSSSLAGLVHGYCVSIPASIGPTVLCTVNMHGQWSMLPLTQRLYERFICSGRTFYECYWTS